MDELTPDNKWKCICALITYISSSDFGRNSLQCCHSTWFLWPLVG